MSPRHVASFVLLSALSASALARAEDLPGDSPSPRAGQGTQAAVVEPPRPQPEGNASARPRPPSRPEPAPSSDPLPPARTVSRWYGGQTLLVDGASLALFFVGLRLDGDSGAPIAAFGTLGYVFGGPIVHLAHDSPWRAAGSAALRSGLPLVFGAIGGEIQSCSAGDAEGLCRLGGFLLGGLVGVATAVIVDSALLAREQIPERGSAVPSIGFFSDGQRTLVTAGGHF